MYNPILEDKFLDLLHKNGTMDGLDFHCSDKVITEVRLSDNALEEPQILCGKDVYSLLDFNDETIKELRDYLIYDMGFVSDYD